MKNIRNSKEMEKENNETKINENFGLIFNNKGITLIVLVITIIVLIILAGVSISLALGDDGLITKAREQQKRQDIVRISEKLEIEKASVATENVKGIVPIDEYIKYIKQKNIITDSDIEIVSEADAYITVEGKYLFLLEQEDNNNLKITYQGEPSQRKPVIDSIDISNTTNTISLKVNTTKADNGTYKYYIKDTENGEYEEKSSIKSDQYVYENLEQNKKYYIKVVVIAKNNQTAEKEILRTTGTVEGLTDTNTTFTYSPDGWTNGNVTATARTEVTGYTLQTSKNGKDWTNTSSQTFSENGTIYARVVDNIGQATGYTSGNVDKIDKALPDEATIEIIGETTQASSPVTLNVKVTHLDANSGIDITSCKYVLNTTSTEIGTDESSYSDGIFSNNQQTIEIRPSSSTDSWYIHVLSIDNVGNKKESIKGPITITEKYHNHTDECKQTVSGTCYVTWSKSISQFYCNACNAYIDRAYYYESHSASCGSSPRSANSSGSCMTGWHTSPVAPR